MRTYIRAAMALTAALTGGLAAMPAAAQYGRDVPPPGFRLDGPGVRVLLPALRDNPRGRAFAMHYDFNRDGIIDPPEADAANRAFARPRPPRGVEVERHGGFDRGAMHGLGFRQTTRGAALDLDTDVLFATDSATLRPHALDRLRPLAGYLRDTRGLRVAIDGYTDARGTDAHNQALSERRAASVRDALADMGADRARFGIVGHGERDPIATNATAAGQRRNRRVEVTLLGRRASEF